ncbi:MAG: PHP domain-containing protein, partial [Clostridiaceae bacterium]|nr:PHP domain-containing protein [Clostridiaceae bacterium]
MSQTSREQTLRLLDDRDPAVRLAAVRRLAEREAEARPAASRDVNNHIHTVYSFSPYTPSRAVWEALDAGLATAGIMDHDTVAGAAESREAGRLLGLPVTVGAELRVSFAGTPIAGRRINNPDQEGVAYLAFHGVPASQIDAVDRFFRPVKAARGVRNRVKALRIDRLAREAGTSFDYDRDVLPLSEAARGGSVTERHLLYALGVQLMRSRPDRSSWSGLLRTLWGLNPGEKTVRRITDPGNPHVLYDLLGIFKSELLPSVYEPATDELVPVRTA